MGCNPFCLTDCYGGWNCGGGGTCCGYCSECVASAACNPALCSSCMTGTVTDLATGQCEPTAGTNASICANVDVSACLPFAGTDNNGNDIYQLDCGNLVYSDGSPATESDIACNEGACSCTICSPCSPHTCGTSCQPPRAGQRTKPSTAGAPQGGGSGGGTGGGSGGASNPKCNQMSALTQAMSKFGSTIAALLAGGKTTTQKQVLPGQKTTGTVMPMSANTFALILFIFGGLLLWMAFGHKPTGD